MYSCAIWGPEEDGPNGDLTVGPKEGDLEAAQHRKVHHILKLARVRPGDRLLEIGSGWGAVSIEVCASLIVRLLVAHDSLFRRPKWGLRSTPLHFPPSRRR